MQIAPSGYRRQMDYCPLPGTIIAAARSAIMMVASLVFPLMTCGITEASATRSLSMPHTFNCRSTTDSAGLAHSATRRRMELSCAVAFEEGGQVGIACRRGRYVLGDAFERGCIEEFQAELDGAKVAFQVARCRQVVGLDEGCGSRILAGQPDIAPRLGMDVGDFHRQAIRSLPRCRQSRLTGPNIVDGLHEHLGIESAVFIRIEESTGLQHIGACHAIVMKGQPLQSRSDLPYPFGVMQQAGNAWHLGGDGDHQVILEVLAYLRTVGDDRDIKLAKLIGRTDAREQQ